MTDSPLRETYDLIDTYAQTARGADIFHPTVGERMGCAEKETLELSETPRTRREAEVELELGKLLRFLRGAESGCVAAGNEARSTLLECGSLSMASSSSRLLFGAGATALCGEALAKCQRVTKIYITQTVTKLLHEVLFGEKYIHSVR